MGTYNFNPIATLSYSSHLLLLFLMVFLCFKIGNSQSMNPLDPLFGLVCQFINCGKGTCFPTNATLLHFDCMCDSGWKKLQIGDLEFPSCVVPNCTINFDCGSKSPPLPPPPPPQLPDNDPCKHYWCGDGNCVNDGGKSVCACNPGSANLLDMNSAACFKECYFGADCQGLGFGFGPPASPPTSTIGSTQNGSGGVPNSSRAQHTLSMLLLVALFVTWF